MITSAIGNIVGFVGAMIFVYGLFELNKFLGVGIVLVTAAQAALRYAKAPQE